MADLAPHHATVPRVSRTDPDPRVCHPADGRWRVAGGRSLTHAAAGFGGARNRRRRWVQRFAADGRAGFAERGRRGRPPTFRADALPLSPRAP